MPQIGITRELSVGEVSQIQHRKNVSIISILAILFIGAFFFSLRDMAPRYAVGIVFLLGFFLISFINIRLGFVLIIFAFLLSPEINIPGLTLRDFTIRLEDLLLIVLLLAWLGRLAMGLQKNFMIWTPLNMPILLIIVWNIICSYHAISAGMVDPKLSILVNLKILEFFAVYFIIINNMDSLKEVKFILGILLIVALVVGVYAVFQIPTTEIFTTHRLSAPFEGRPEPGTLAGYLAIFFGISLCMAMYAKKSFLKNIGIILAILLPFPIMFSFSRTSYLATLGILIVTAIITRKKWLIITLILFFILSPFILPKAVINRALYNFQDPRYFGFLDQSAAERVFIYRKAFDSVRAHTIFGNGIGAFGGIIDSQYARVIIETGIIGFCLFIFLISRLFVMSVSLFKKVKEGWLKGYALGFLVVVICMLVHSYGAVSFYIIRIAEPFWALAALAGYALFEINSRQSSAAGEVKN